MCHFGSRIHLVQSSNCFCLLPVSSSELGGLQRVMDGTCSFWPAGSNCRRADKQNLRATERGWAWPTGSNVMMETPGPLQSHEPKKRAAQEYSCYDTESDDIVWHMFSTIFNQRCQLSFGQVRPARQWRTRCDVALFSSRLKFGGRWNDETATFSRLLALPHLPWVSPLKPPPPPTSAGSLPLPKETGLDSPCTSGGI